MAYTEEQKITFIYALCDPVTNRIRYIGKADNVEKRLKSHLRDCRRRKTPVYNWINKLLRNDLTPNITVLETVIGDWQNVEKRIIAQYRKTHKDLLNVADGGDEPFCPIEVRQENGRKVAQIIHSDPKKKKLWGLKRDMADMIKRGFANQEVRIKLRALARKRPDLLGCFVDISID